MSERERARVVAALPSEVPFELLPIDTMLVPVTTTGSLRRNDRSARLSSSPRSVTPPTGDAPRFDQASAPATAAALEAGLASSHRAGARARRMGADGDRGYAPRAPKPSDD
jgi:hypothetical protein